VPLLALYLIRLALFSSPSLPPSNPRDISHEIVSHVLQFIYFYYYVFSFDILFSFHPSQFIFSPIFIGLFMSLLVTFEGKPSLVVPKLKQVR
jgi:hypothetical protein